MRPTTPWRKHWRVQPWKRGPRWERHSRQSLQQCPAAQPHHDREQHGLQRTRRWHRTQGADYVQILNNVVHDNAHWSAYGNSGISVAASANLDTIPGPHPHQWQPRLMVTRNWFRNTGASAITDGEGIILDSNPGYMGEFLVQNNTVYNNGAPESCHSRQIT